MKIVEIRVILPIKLERYPYAEDYMVARRTLEEADNGGEGIECTTRGPYENEKEKGIYAHKIYHYGSRVPKWLRWAVPPSLTDFHEKSWNAFPHGLCEFSIQGLGSHFQLSLESFSSTLDDISKLSDPTFNPAFLTPEELEKREVMYLDITASEPKPSSPDLACAGFECEAEGIQKLEPAEGKIDPAAIPHWVQNYKGGAMMMCAKVVRAHIDLWGLRKKLEKWVSRSLIPGILLDSARGIVAWSPFWTGLSREDIDKYTDECFQKVVDSIKKAQEGKKDKKKKDKAEEEKEGKAEEEKE